MKASGKFTKTEAVLLVLTLLFLLATAAAFGVRCAGSRTPYVITADAAAAQPLSDEETAAAETEPEIEIPTAEHPLNINAADEAQLDLLPEIGPVLAGRIVAYRTEHGPFARTEDLMQVEGIGEGIYGEIQDLVTVEEAQT